MKGNQNVVIDNQNVISGDKTYILGAWNDVGGNSNALIGK